MRGGNAALKMVNRYWYICRKMKEKEPRYISTTVLAGDLEVAELLVEEDVRLAEKESAHGRFRPEGQNVDSAPLEDLQIPLRQRVLQRVVVVLQIVEVNDVALTCDQGR